jgi:hypothetical protein
MTADQVKGKSFRGALNYNLEKVEKGVAKWLDTSFVHSNERAIMEEVRMIRVMRPNLAKYFYHTSVNFPPEENLSDERMKTIAKEYLEGMGFDQHQFAIFRHFDADHPHFHILVNRIGYDGSVVADSQDYKRSERVLRKLEKRYGLTEVISSKLAQERAMTKNELEMMKRTDEPSFKLKLQVTIKAILDKKPTAEQFINLLEAKGINVLFNQASTGFVSGISYGYNGMQFKGAHLGNAYKWQAIKNGIGYEQERDRKAIYQANVRTRAGRSERAGRTAATAESNRIGPDQRPVNRNTANVSQGAGKLQNEIRKAARNNIKTAGADGKHNSDHGISDPNDRSKRGADRQSQQQSGQQVGDQALPGSDLIRSLLGTNHPSSGMDQTAISEFKRKRKKRKGQRLS